MNNNVPNRGKGPSEEQSMAMDRRDLKFSMCGSLEHMLNDCPHPYTRQLAFPPRKGDPKGSVETKTFMLEEADRTEEPTTESNTAEVQNGPVLMVEEFESQDEVRGAQYLPEEYTDEERIDSWTQNAYMVREVLEVGEVGEEGSTHDTDTQCVMRREGLNKVILAEVAQCEKLDHNGEEN